MTFTRFVEVGRVALINYGDDRGKLCTIIDIVDSKRVLVDGPQSITGVHRQVISLKRLSLTDLVVSRLPRNSTNKNLVKAWNEQNIESAWKNSSWARKLANKQTRANLNDFSRFKVMVAKKQKSKIIAAKVAELSA
jgi:large subunit ribosomal protein L14e